MNESQQPALAHGLDGSLAEPDWPPLTLDELRPVLQHFLSAGEPIRIVSTSPRPLSAAAVIETTQGRIFIKPGERCD